MTRDELVNLCGNGIASDALANGYEPRWLGSNGKGGDAQLDLWLCNGVRAISTNGDPVWEECDPTGFAGLLEEIAVDQNMA